LNIYIARLQENYSEALSPTSPTTQTYEQVEGYRCYRCNAETWCGWFLCL